MWKSKSCDEKCSIMNCYRFRVDMAKSSQTCLEYPQSRLRSALWKWAGRSLYHLYTPTQIRSQVLVYIAAGSTKLRIIYFNRDFLPVQSILELSFPRTNKCPPNTTYTYIWYRERKDRCMFWFIIRTSSDCKLFLKTGDNFLVKSKNMQLFLCSLYHKYVTFDGSWSIFFVFITTGWVTLS
jgi:hypothetical protein